MTATLDPAAAAFGLLRLVLLDQADAAGQLVDALTERERQAVAGFLERCAAGVAVTILGTVRGVGLGEPVHAATVVAELLDLSAWLAGIGAADVERVLLERVDACITAALGLEPVAGA